MRRRYWALIASLAIVVLLAGGALVYFKTKKPAYFFPANIRQNQSITLYYPKVLLDGYTVDPSSFSQNDSAVVFAAKNANGDSLNFSLQAKPNKFDFEQFYRDILKDPKSYSLSIGQATVGKINVGVMVNILTDKTWIIVNSKSPLDYGQLEPMIYSFKQER